MVVMVNANPETLDGGQITGVRLKESVKKAEAMLLAVMVFVTTKVKVVLVMEIPTLGLRTDGQPRRRKGKMFYSAREIFQMHDQSRN